MGYIRFPDGTETKPFEFFNSGKGFNFFWNHISPVLEAWNLEEVIFGFESTGPYGLPLVHYLRKRKVNLVQVNPMHTKRLKELQGNSPNKTDLKDPKVIADIIELGHALSLVVPEGVAAELRCLTHARDKSSGMRTVLFNQLQSLVFPIFPEFTEIMKDTKTKSALHLLKHYPASEDIVELGIESLTLILKKVSRGRLGKQRAKDLYDAAIESAGVKEGLESVLFEIKNILNHIKVSENFISEAEAKIKDYLVEIPYSKVMLSMRGIGYVTVAGLIGEVGDFKKFKTISEIEKLAGFDLFEISSGKHKGQRRISKRGRPLMRKLLYFAALNAIREGGIFQEEYERRVKKGMVKMKALIAIARKILRVIFALVRNHSKFVKDYNKSPQPLLKVA